VLAAEPEPVPCRAELFKQGLGHVGRLAGDFPVILRAGQHRHHADRKDELQRVLYSLRAAWVGDGCQHAQQA
jgi:hypothetical protein